MTIAGRAALMLTLGCLAYPAHLRAELEVTARFEVDEQDTRFIRVQAAVAPGAPPVSACYLYFATPARDEYTRFEMERLEPAAFDVRLRLTETTVSNLLYYVEAVDSAGSVVDRAGAAVYPKAYRYDPDDDQPPRFHRVRCPDILVEDPLVLSGVVNDPSGVGGVAAFYRHTSEPDFSRCPVITDASGNFDLHLPASLADVPGVEYYLEAWDLWGNIASYGDLDNPRRVFVRPRSIVNPVFRFIDRPIWMGLISVPSPEPVEPGLSFLEVSQFVSRFSEDFLHRVGMTLRFDLGRWARIGLDYGPGDKADFSLGIPLFGGNSGILARSGAGYSRTSLLVGLREGGSHHAVIGRDFSLFNRLLLNGLFGAGRGRYTAGDPSRSLGWFAAMRLADENLLDGKLNLTVEKDVFNWHVSLIDYTRPGLRLKAGWTVPSRERSGMLVVGVASPFGL